MSLIIFKQLATDTFSPWVKEKENTLAFLWGSCANEVIFSVQFSTEWYIAGKVAWRREESLAYTAAVDMLDLPVSENQAKFEDEFGSSDGIFSHISFSVNFLTSGIKIKLKEFF